ncbi:PD-(D/E)XK nuclease-like domain-containing protein [Lactococcus fujiensis]|uniref:PD-(D/E)XK nuclease-like domain-containing protein n=1 Tax=Lactococcus fujiensis TaxID=610251 RepID=UPI0025B00D8D|nr:PD-(D/E)XK nuclease-like domain-containing protein [Lactococcus fujiensis]
MPQDWLDDALIEVQEATNKYIEVLNGRVPVHCGRCNYCKANKYNTHTISLTELL